MLVREHIADKAIDLRATLKLEVAEDNVTLLPETRQAYVQELALAEALLVAYDLGAIEAEWDEVSNEPLFHPTSNERWSAVDEKITEVIETLQICSDDEWHAYVNGHDMSLLG